MIWEAAMVGIVSLLSIDPRNQLNLAIISSANRKKCTGYFRKKHLSISRQRHLAKTISPHFFLLFLGLLPSRRSHKKYITQLLAL